MRCGLTLQRQMVSAWHFVCFAAKCCFARRARLIVVLVAWFGNNFNFCFKKELPVSLYQRILGFRRESVAVSLSYCVWNNKTDSERVVIGNQVGKKSDEEKCSDLWI